MSDSKKNGNSFHVRIENLGLSEEAKDRIEKGVQEVVLREFSNYFPADDSTSTGPKKPNPGGPVSFMNAKYWRGIIAMPFNKGALENVQQIVGSKVLYE